MQKFPLKKGLSSAQELHEEINDYIDVLMGHINPPIADGVDTLFEVSSTYLARAKDCLLYTSPSPRDCRLSRMPSSA